MKIFPGEFFVENATINGSCLYRKTKSKKILRLDVISGKWKVVEGVLLKALRVDFIKLHLPESDEKSFALREGYEE